MPPVLAATLLTVVAVALLLRRVPALQRAHRGRVTTADKVLGALGGLGLLAHCVAMFYPELLGSVPGASGYIRAVTEIGPVSMVLYAVPATLLVGAARRRSPGFIAALAFGVLAVGVTMYDDGPLWLHLIAITLLVVLLAWIATPLSEPVR